MKFIIIIIIFCCSTSMINAQKYIYFNRNEIIKVLFVSFTDDLQRVKQLHENGEISLTKNWTNHNIEHFETVEDKSEAIVFVSTLDEGRLEIPKGFNLISDIRYNQDIDEMLDRVNKRANSQISYNKYQGDYTEQQVEEVIRQQRPKTELVRQVCLKNSKGMSFIDIAYKDESNNLILLEVKSSSNAYKRYGKSNQIEVHNEIKISGAELCSNDDDILSFFLNHFQIHKGDKIPPTKVIPVKYD